MYRHELLDAIWDILDDHLDNEYIKTPFLNEAKNPFWIVLLSLDTKLIDVYLSMLSGANLKEMIKEGRNLLSKTDEF
jgi:hypothetical protein|tara:strand:+ start:537 stop:767 length:231 start_codon:yes stop_codon:yes gene_type:complete